MIRRRRAAAETLRTRQQILADDQLVEDLRAGRIPKGRLGRLLAAWRRSVVRP